MSDGDDSSDDEPHIVCNSCGIKAYYERNEVAYDANYCRGCDTIEPHNRNGCRKPNPDEIVRGTIGGESPKPTLTDVAKQFPESPKGAGFKITRTKDSEYTVSRLRGTGGGAGAPPILYRGNLNGIGQVLRAHLDADFVDKIMNRVSVLAIQGHMKVRQGQPLEQM